MKLYWFLVPWLAGTLAAEDGEFRKRIEKAREGNDDKAWAEAISEWRKAEPGSPEPLIAEANRLFRNANSVRIDTGKPGKDDLEIKDPKTGETKGRLSAGTPDPKLCSEALAVLKQALDLAPDRLDIRGGMAYICQESGRFEEELEVLKAMGKQALARPAEQRWLNGAALDTAVEKFVPEKLHSYGMYYYKMETPEGDKRFGAVAQLITENYPANPVGWNDLALFRYLAQKDTKGAAEALEKAAKLDPSDSIVQFNLAKFYAELGAPAKARTIYERIIASSKESKEVENAKEKLKELGKRIEKKR